IDPLIENFPPDWGLNRRLESGCPACREQIIDCLQHAGILRERPVLCGAPVRGYRRKAAERVGDSPISGVRFVPAEPAAIKAKAVDRRMAVSTDVHQAIGVL